MKNERLEIRIDEQLKERLKDAAEKTDKKAAVLVREAVLEKIENVENAPAPEKVAA